MTNICIVFFVFRSDRMASSSLRSSAGNWLLGKPNSELSTARLPRGLDALRLFQFYHVEEGHSIPESYKFACEEVISVWERARIPNQREITVFLILDFRQGINFGDIKQLLQVTFENVFIHSVCFMLTGAMLLQGLVPLIQFRQFSHT